MRPLRRILSATALSLIVLVAGGTAGASLATAAAHAPAAHSVTSKPKTKPTSTVPGTQVRGEKFTRYCVSHYKPNSTVKVVNKKTGKVTYIHTNSKGAGCAEVPVVPGCQSIVASGPDASGSSTSSATVCVLGKAIHRGSGTLPFTGSNTTIPGIFIGLGLVGIGAALTFLARRRRTVGAVA